MGGEFGFGRFSGQPILVPSAIHVLPKTSKNTISELTGASVVPQWNNFMCYLLINNGGTLLHNECDCTQK